MYVYMFQNNKFEKMQKKQSRELIVFFFKL